MGPCGGLDCFSIPCPHLLNSVRTRGSHPLPWRPGCGTELGACSWTVPVLSTGLDPCWSHSPAARSSLLLLSWLPSTFQQDSLAQPLPSLALGWPLDAAAPHWDRAVPRDCLPQLLQCWRLPLFPSPAPRAAPVGKDPARAAGAVHSSDSRAAPAPPSPSIHREGVAGARDGWEQQELGLGRQQPGLAAPEAADVKIKGRSCPGSVWELLPHSALWLWFIRMWVLAQPP